MRSDWQKKKKGAQLHTIIHQYYTNEVITVEEQSWNKVRINRKYDLKEALHKHQLSKRKTWSSDTAQRMNRKKESEEHSKERNIQYSKILHR